MTNLVNQMNKNPNANNSSSIEKPLNFFNYFFEYGGFYKYHRNCLQDIYQNIEAHIKEFDKEKEMIYFETWDQELGEMVEWSISFNEELAKKLYSEYLLTIRFIDEKINTLNRKTDIKLFIKKTIPVLKHLFITVQKNSEMLKYKANSFFILEIIKIIISKYKPFCPKLDNTTKEIIGINIIPQIQQQSNSITKEQLVTGFEWKISDNIRCSFLLHSELVRHSIISDDIDVTIFHKLFSNETILSTDKIKWIDRAKNSFYNKQSLFYLLNQLAANDLIFEDYDNKNFIKKIEAIFIDGDGNQFKNLLVSNSASSKVKEKKTPTEKTIDDIIKLLLSGSKTI